MKLDKTQAAEYNRYVQDRIHGRILDPWGLRFICEAYDYDATKIGEHFLQLLPKLLKGNVYEN